MHAPSSQHELLLLDAVNACWLAALSIASGSPQQANDLLWDGICALHDRTLILRADIAGEVSPSRLAEVWLS